jgi:hypothetical protein
MLGEIQIESDHLLWFVHKTFISRETAGLKLFSTADELIEVMKNNLVKANYQNDKELHEELLKLYHNFGLMENNNYSKDIEIRMKEIVKEVQEKNMPETDFWVIT